LGGDTVLQPGEDVVAADRSHQKAALPAWACTGLVLLGSDVVASWGRSRGRVTILALTSLDGRQRRTIEAEAVGMPLPERPDVLWRTPR
jgi:hypothetical protein